MASDTSEGLTVADWNKMTKKLVEYTVALESNRTNHKNDNTETK